jgi:hypothetical protein
MAHVGRAMQATSVAIPPPVKWIVVGARAVGGWLRKDYRWVIFLVVFADLGFLSFLGYVREAVNHTPLVTVRVAAGSENAPLLQDPATVAFFASKGITLQVKSLGSGQIAAAANLHGYDAYLVSSDYFANQTVERLTHLTADQGTFSVIRPFSTPLAVLTRTSLLGQLEQAGIVTTTNGHQEFNVLGYLNAVLSGTRWSNLSGDDARWNGQQITLATTNPASSDSAAMFVNVGAYAFNQENKVTNQTPPDQVSQITQKLGTVFGKQETARSTTYQLYIDFAHRRWPMVLGYESERQPAQADGPFPPWGTWLPLTDTVDCVHSVVPVTTIGTDFANDLSDPGLQKLERQYFFEPASGPGFEDIGSPVPESSLLPDLIRDVIKVAGIKP